MPINNRTPNGTQPHGLIDPVDPGFHSWEQAEWDRAQTNRAALRTIITDIAKSGRENYPGDHRTGFFTDILDIMAVVLMEEGWSLRTVTDALVLEAVRAGGNLEKRVHRERMAARKAKAVQS